MKEKEPVIPKIGCLYQHNDYVCLIVGGRYKGTYGVSNFWSWRRIENGKLCSTIETGYGQDFYGPYVLEDLTIKIDVGELVETGRVTTYKAVRRKHAKETLKKVVK